MEIHLISGRSSECMASREEAPVIVSWCPLFASTVVIALRIFARISGKRSFNVSGYFILTVCLS